MRRWTLCMCKSLLFMAILVLVGSLALVGCDGGGDGDGDDLEAADLSGRTFNNLDLGVIDSNLEGQTGTLEFGAATNDTVPFTLVIGGDVIEGSARVFIDEEFEFTVFEINDDSIVGVDVTIPGDPDDVTFIVGDSFEVDADIDTDGDRQTITLTNPDTGFSQDFVFDSPDDTSSTGSTGG